MTGLLNKVRNKVLDGFILGLLCPGILAIAAWYIIHYVTLMARADLLYIGCIAVNAWLMQYYFKQQKENAGRGILSATFVCAFIFYFYKINQ